MKIVKIVLKVVPIGILAFLTFFLLMNASLINHKVEAYETSCPEYMTNSQCLAYLQEQAALIAQQKNNLEYSIGAEDLEQASLYQQISYLATQIEETELNIAEKELQIEKKNVEMNLLGEEIAELQNSIDTLTQEINVLEDTMEKRTKTSYKMTLMSPLEMLLDSQNLETLMRKMKYVIEAKKKDRELMADMSISKNHLANEEEILDEKRGEVQKKRNEVESKRADLAREQKNLEEQKGQQQSLLAQSQQREQQYLAQLENTRAQQSSLDAQISELIAKMWESGELASEGYIGAGTPIGLMGTTGCSTGAHLHFAINNGAGHPTYWYFYGNISPWGGYLTKGPDSAGPGGGGWIYYYIRSGSFQLPLAGPVVITQDFHQGMAVDLVSLQGAGATVFSAHEGTLTRGTESICGGKFAVIEHPSGYVTGYLHLQ